MDEQRRSAFELGTDGPASILAGVDGTEPSYRAAAYAAGLARRQHSRLTIVFARELTASAVSVFDRSGMAAMAQSELHDAIEQDLLEGLQRYVYELDVGVEVRSGPALKVITQVAEEVRAECVVVGSSRPAAFLRSGGPVPSQLMKLRRWPVIVVP